MNHYGCDRCGRVTTKEEMAVRKGLIPQGWQNIQLLTSVPRRLGNRFDFCQACSAHLKIGSDGFIPDDKPLADRLIELLAEMAQGVVDSQ